MVLRAHDFGPESVAAFHTAGQLDLNDYRWPYLEGLTLVQTDPDAGLGRLRRAAEIAPKDRPEPRLRLAELLLERGDADGAARLAEVVLDAAPRHPRAELILARVAASRDDWKAVLERTAGCAHHPSCQRRPCCGARRTPG